MNLKTYLLIVFAVLTFGCKKETPNNKDSPNKLLVLNIENAENSIRMKNLNLDSIYPNLLDPKNITDSEKEVVFNSWISFHDKLSDFIKEENFEWEVDDSKVKVYQKIYFTQNGEIEYYLYNIRSEIVSKEKKEEFGNLIKKFSPNVKLDMVRKGKYAQCGTNVY